MTHGARNLELCGIGGKETDRGDLPNKVAHNSKFNHTALLGNNPDASVCRLRVNGGIQVTVRLKLWVIPSKDKSP